MARNKFYFTLHYRLNILNLDSLEVRRLRFDLLSTYKMLFGLLRVDCNCMFKFSPVNVTRGHCYKLYAATSRVNVRHNFYCNRVVNIWNRLPACSDNFRNYSSFKSFLMRIDFEQLSHGFI